MNRNPDKDVFRTLFSVFYERVKVPVVVEYTGIEQFVLKLLPRPPAICLDQFAVRKLPLRVLVQILHVGVRRRAVDVEVVLLHILAVVTFAVGQPEYTFLQNRVALVPQGESKTQPLLFIADSAHAVLAPAVGA